MDSLKLLGMAYLTGVDMTMHSFYQYLHSYRYIFTLCYLLQVCMCSYHRYGSVWLYLFQFYSYLQVQPVSIPPASGLVHLGNVRQDFDAKIFPICWSLSVTSCLHTVHPDWIDISFLCLDAQHIRDGGGVAYMLETFVIC